MSKYKVGDRVRYQIKNTGHDELHGLICTIVYVDDSAIPYTIVPDKPIEGGVTDKRIPHHNQYKDSCWFATEENLQPLEKQQTGKLANFEPYKFKKHKGEETMENNKVWSPEEDEKLLQLKAAKKTSKEIAYELGRTEAAVNFRYCQLRKTIAPAADVERRPFRLTDEEMTVPNDVAEEHAIRPNTSEEGELNPLESEMKTIITELTAEKTTLQDYVKELEDNLESAKTDLGKAEVRVAELEGQLKDAVTENYALKETRDGLAKTVESQKAELLDADAALEKTETELDICLQKSRELRELADEQEAVIKELRARLEGAVAATDEDKDREIAILRAEYGRLNNMVISLVEKYLLAPNAEGQ